MSVVYDSHNRRMKYDMHKRRYEKAFIQYQELEESIALSQHLPHAVEVMEGHKRDLLSRMEANEKLMKKYED